MPFTKVLSIIFFFYISLWYYPTNGTSIKFDFLPLGDVRTDPIVYPTCLSDHVHTFYGASSIMPGTTYDDLRSAYGNSGNVEENLSLYWHPTVYSYDPDSGIYTKDEIYFTSAYYIWKTGEATAFPDGFKMIAGVDGDPLARAFAECVGASECERSNCETDSTFFPKTQCAELEVSMAFPTCWDGESIDSDDHRSHVSYDIEGGVFDGECPSSHPVKLPEIQLFFRIMPYSGGKHIFSDGTDYYHADYFSGWDVNELQYVLDECENYSDAAMPDAWCEDFLTFRDKPKVAGEDDKIVIKLKSLQPDPSIDTSEITSELIDNISTLPRGACNECQKTGESCETKSDCCSMNCENNKCLDLCQGKGKYCESNNDCCSKKCKKNKCKKAKKSGPTPPECEDKGDYCESNADCCKKKCNKKKKLCKK